MSDQNGESARERIVGTNERDDAVFSVPFEIAHRTGVPHRVVHVEIFNAKGKYLVVRRSDGRLEIPGGHVAWIRASDRAETYEEAAIREIIEELNLETNWKIGKAATLKRLTGARAFLAKEINQVEKGEFLNNEWVAVFSLAWGRTWGDPCHFERLGSEGNKSPRWHTLASLAEECIRRPTEVNSALRLFMRRRGILIPLRASGVDLVPSQTSLPQRHSHPGRTVGRRTRSMTRWLGVVGNLAKDYYLPRGHVHTKNGATVVVTEANQYEVHPRGVVIAGAKVTVDRLPSELLAGATSERLGGGGFNSLCALKLIGGQLSVRYVDACRLDDSIGQAVGGPTTEVHGLGLREIPSNAIVGDRETKIILKSPIENFFSTLGARQTHVLAKLTECEGILLNSVKDKMVVEAILKAASASGTCLHFVLTESLPLDFTRWLLERTQLSVVANWDQVAYVTGEQAEKTVSGCRKVLSWFRHNAPQCDVFLTMSSLGALVAKAGDASVWHARLRPDIGEEVSRVAALGRRVCGCGDAFAAGVLAERQVGASLLQDDGKVYPEEVKWNLAGNAAAVRWLGYERKLSGEDFVIQSI